MKYAPEKVFVLENNSYIEISYEELCERVKQNEAYASKLFLPLHGMLMEVKQEDYRQFYKAKRRLRYLAEQSTNNGDVSYDSLSADERERAYAFMDHSQNTLEIVIDKLMIERLTKAMRILTEEERMLVDQHFFEGKSEQQLGQLYGVSQQAISKRLRRIIEKIKKIMKI